MPELPGLKDKIFLPISIFALNIALAVFKFALASAVGACFIIYARYGGEYANSVRWVRSAGYLEMYQALKGTNGRTNTPASVKLALVVGIIATLAASILDKGVAGFVTPATQLGQPRRELKVSSQVAPYASPSIFLGWNFVVPNNGSVLEAMKGVLSSSSVIPDRSDEQEYDPVTSPYNVTCNAIGVKLEGEAIRGGMRCATLSFLSRILKNKQLERFKRAPNRWGFVAESSGPNTSVLNAPLDVEFEFLPVGKCNIMENYRPSAVEVSEGFTAFPTTTTTKCYHESGEITALAMSTIRFVHTGDRYNAEQGGKYFAEKDNELILQMGKSVANTTMVIKGQPQNQTRTIGLWVEYRVAFTTIDIYACDYGNGNQRVECVYATVEMNHFKPLNSDIQPRTGDESTSDQNSTIHMSLEYFTGVLNNGEGATPASIRKMWNDTKSVSNYMAELGYNYYASFRPNNGKVFIYYNVAEIKSGLAIPFWVLLVSGIITVLCLVLWQLTDRIIGSPYNISLYSVIRDQLEHRSNASIPSVMRFSFQPLSFEDTKLLPDQHDGISEVAQFLPGHVKSI